MSRHANVAFTLQCLISMCGIVGTIAFNQPKVGRVKAGPIEISSMGCGTWSWGNRILWDYDPSKDDEIYAAYREVRDAGVTLFDTADSYGTLELNGRSEILLGEFDRRYQEEQRKKFGPFSSFLPSSQTHQVATKFAPYPWRVTRGSMVNAAKASLERLDCEKITLAQLHWSTANYQPFQERTLWEGIADVYDQGLCDAVGVSNYGPIQLEKISNRMVERDVPLATAQVQYSLMTYKANGDIKDVCDSVGCRLISYSPLCLGLLTGKYNLDNLPRPGNPRRQLFRELLPGAQELLKLLEVVAADYGKTQSQIAINWTICKGGVPIPGARTLQHAKDNVAATGWRLKNDAIEELDKAASQVSKPMIQNIFQTK